MFGFNPMNIFGDQSGAFNNASDAFNQQAQRFNPWIQRGDDAGKLAFEQYQQSINNPNFQQDRLAKNWSESPFQSQLLANLTRRMNMNAANSGMIQSPVAQDALNKQLNTQTGQFMNDYVTQGLDQYNRGLSGLQGIDSEGLNALDKQGDVISAGIGARLKGAQSQSQAWNNLLGYFMGNAQTGGKMAAMGMSGGAAAPFLMSNQQPAQNNNSSTFNMGGY